MEKDFLEKLPENPGVYLMKDRRGHVLYVGKAKSLRQRVRQYFVPGSDSRAMIPYLVEKVDRVDTIVVSSEKEALLLENTLIKRHMPPYNAIFRDDKSYICLKVTTKDVWPRVLVVRRRAEDIGDGVVFGPYTSAIAARDTYDILCKLFPLRQCSDEELLRRTRPCILYQMKRCVAPCVGFCTHQDYDAIVKRVVRFLRGYDREVIADLKEEVARLSENLEFERAGELHKIIKHLESTLEKQNVDTMGGEDADAVGLYREGGEVVVAQLIFREGRLTDTRKHVLSGICDDPEDVLRGFVMTHYRNALRRPKVILLPCELPEVAVLEELLAAEGPRVEISCPSKGRPRAQVALAQENAKAVFRQEKDEHLLREKVLLEMQEKLRLSRYPGLIECFDTSHIGGEEMVAAMVAFYDGEKDTKRYRKFKVKTVTGGDDYGAMREVLQRRYARAKEENNLPDLIVIDGGKAHLNVAVKVLEALDIASIDVIALVKEEGRHDKGATREGVFLRGVKDPVLLKNSSVLFLLQRIRDEAHRFAITFQRQRRTKTQLKSELADLPGIGPTKEKMLLKRFGSVKGLAEATREDLFKTPKLSHADIETLWAFIVRKQS